MTVTINFDLSMLLLFGLNVLAVFIYIGRLKLNEHRMKQAKARIVAEVSAYFAKSSVAVKAEVIALPAINHYIIVADTEPLKRFRHSNIVEMMLINDVKNATGHTVDKVFWRFPLTPREDAAIEAIENITISPPSTPEIDAYLEQGLERLSLPGGLEVHEDSWAHFQEAVHEREEAQDAAGEAENGRPPPLQ